MASIRKYPLCIGFAVLAILLAPAIWLRFIGTPGLYRFIYMDGLKKQQDKGVVMVQAVYSSLDTQYRSLTTTHEECHSVQVYRRLYNIVCSTHGVLSIGTLPNVNDDILSQKSINAKNVLKNNGWVSPEGPLENIFSKNSDSLSVTYSKKDCHIKFSFLAPDESNPSTLLNTELVCTRAIRDIIKGPRF